MRSKIVWVIIGIIVIAAGVFVLKNNSAPKAESDGKISGNYSIESIVALGKPYECSLVKSDGSSEITGTIRLADNKLRGDFDLDRIPSTNTSGQNFSGFASHFIIVDDAAYVWTSLYHLGYKSPVAKSAGASASPTEQSQIIGMSDKENYTCLPWNPNLSIFEIPSGITFSELK